MWISPGRERRAECKAIPSSEGSNEFADFVGRKVMILC